MTKYILPEKNIIKQQNSNEFIGIKIENGEPYLYVPLSFNISKDLKERNKDILLLLKSLSYAKKDEQSFSKTTLSEKSNFWPIDSYLWLIHDFINNGFYYNREKSFTRNEGKIDWKKTLQTQPIVSNGNVVYFDLITYKYSPNEDDISDIYKFCISLSLDRIGWMFNYSITILIKNRMSIKEMKYKVRNATRKTFDDIKRLRFTHMMNILSNLDEDDTKSTEHTYGVYNYYHVYECMIDKYFKGIDADRLLDYYPHGIWHPVSNHKKSYPSSELKPDTIHHEFKNSEKYTYIIDAKMYKYGGLETIKKVADELPPSSSIQKQITYGEYVQNFVDINYKVRNAFILPFNKHLDRFSKEQNEAFFCDNDRNLAYIGYANGDWRLLKMDDNGKIILNDYDYIFTFLIDFNYLLNNYKKEDEKILHLFDKIEEELVKIKNYE